MAEVGPNSKSDKNVSTGYRNSILKPDKRSNLYQLYPKLKKSELCFNKLVIQSPLDLQKHHGVGVLPKQSIQSNKCISNPSPVFSINQEIVQQILLCGASFRTGVL